MGRILTCPVLKGLSSMVSCANEDEITNTPFIRIIFISSGTCDIVINNKVLNLRTSSIIVLNKLTNYKISNGNTDFVGYFLDIDFICTTNIDPIYISLSSIISSIMELFAINNNYIYCNDTNSLHYRMISLLQIYMLNSYENKELLVMLALYTILINLDNQVSLIKLKQSYPYNKYINNTMIYINDNLSKNIDIKEIANHVGVHANYLHNMFLKETKMHIVDYINQKRIEMAKYLLGSTNFSTNVIAERCGFNNKYFFRVFKKYTNFTPIEFRKNFNLTNPNENPYMFDVVDYDEYVQCSEGIKK